MILFSEAELKEFDGDIDELNEPEGGLEGTNEGYTPDMDGMMQIVLEASEDWAVLQEAIMYGDMVELAESYKPGGNALLIQEANVSDFFEKVKNFFKKMWGHITEYFKKFLDQLAAWLMSEKKFVEKYDSAFSAALSKLKKFEKKGTAWNIDPVMAGLMAAKTNIETVSKSTKTVISGMMGGAAGRAANQENVEKEFKTLADKFRGKLLGDANKAIEANEFGKYLKYTIRNGAKKAITDTEPEKKTWKQGDNEFGKIMGELKSAADTKKKVTDAKKAMDEAFKSILKAIDEEKSAANKRTTSTDDEAKLKGADISIYSKAHASYKSMMSSASRTCGALTSALRARNLEYKSVVVAVIAATRPYTGKGLKEETDPDLPDEMDEVGNDVDTDEKDNSEEIEATQESAISRYLNRKRV